MSGKIAAIFPLPFEASGLSAVMAAKLRPNDEALICGTLDEPVELPLGALDVLLLLLQAAAIRAADAATAVRAILLLLRKSNETTSFVGLDLRTQIGASRPWARFGRSGRPLSGKP